MLKKLIRCSALFLFTMSLFIGFAQTAEAARRRFLRIRYEGRYSSVRLYINGDSKGRISRGQSRSFYLRTRRTYRIRTSYAGKNYRTSVYLPSFKNKRITITRPTRGRRTIIDGDRPIRGRRRYNYLILRYRGSKPYVRIEINGRKYGKLYRRTVRRIRKRAGRSYRVVAKFGFRRVRKTVFLSRSGNRRVTFYRP